MTYSAVSVHDYLGTKGMAHLEAVLLSSLGTKDASVKWRLIGISGDPGDTGAGA